MTDKFISSRDYYISIEQARAYASLGKLKIGIDRTTGQHLTNNQSVLRLADDAKLLKSAWRAHNFWTYVMVGYFILTIYLSFTNAWWWFLIGLVSLPFLNSMIVKSNEENLLDILIKDEGLYSAMFKAKRLNYLVDEEIIFNLVPREESE